MSADRHMVERAESLLKSHFADLLEQRHEEMLADLAGDMLGVFRTRRPVATDYDTGADFFAEHRFRADDFSTVGEFLDQPCILTEDACRYVPLRAVKYDDMTTEWIRELILGCALDAARRLDEDHEDESEALRDELQVGGEWTPMDVCVPLDREEVDAELALYEALRRRPFVWLLTTGSRRIAEKES